MPLTLYSAELMFGSWNPDWLKPSVEATSCSLIGGLSLQLKLITLGWSRSCSPIVSDDWYMTSNSCELTPRPLEDGAHLSQHWKPASMRMPAASIWL